MLREENDFRGKDEIARDEAIANMTKTEKAAYIWHYYKWIILLIIGAIALVTAIAVSMYNKAQVTTIANITLVNCDGYAVDQSDYFTQFHDDYGYDESEQLEIDSTVKVDVQQGGEQSSAGFQMLAASFMAGYIDIFVSDEDLYIMECDKNGLVDVREYVSEEMLSSLSDKFFYYTNEETGEETPVGIIMNDLPMCNDLGFYKAPESQIILGLSVTSQADTETIQNLIEYMCK